MLSTAKPPSFLPPGHPDDVLAYVIETMRAMSRETDPQKMVREYGARVRKLMHTDRFTSLSRRGLQKPNVRITRSSLFEAEVNPWEAGDSLPIMPGGLLSDLIWSDQPVIIDDFQADPADPAFYFLDGMRSLMAIPLYDQGSALNMVVLGRIVPNGFDRDSFPQQVWMSNLFGRATHNLYLSQEVQKAYDAVDREMKVVADIQQSLLPAELPAIAGLDVAAHYQTSRRAGGDYYDFFPLADGRWGIIVADVSGHGTPAAVIMAVTHSIAHAHHGDPDPPGKLLSFVNHHLATRYTGGKGTFVTAFYGIFDPIDRTLVYSSAGHLPPRVLRAATGLVESFEGARNLPLGIEPTEAYRECHQQLHVGDAMVIYTDGITEARDDAGGFFGTDPIDDVLTKLPVGTAAEVVLSGILKNLDGYTRGAALTDDRTVLVLVTT